MTNKEREERWRKALEEAVAWIEDDRFDDEYISEEWYHMAKDVLQEAGDES